MSTGEVVEHDAVEHGVRPRRTVVNTAAPEVGVGIALLLLVGLFCLLEGQRFATLDNLRSILVDASSLTLLAMATTYVLISRNLDLSIGGVIAFAEIVAVDAMVEDGGVASGLTGLAVAVAAGGAWGAVNAGLIVGARIPPFVATLATLGMAQGAAYVIGDGLNLTSVPRRLAEDVGAGEVLGVPVLALIALSSVLVAVVVLRHMRFGRYTYAIGSDPVAAERAGIDVAAHTAKIFVIAGLVYGFVAWLNVARFATTSVAGHSTDALNAITAVALGGTSLFGGVGTAVGSVIGVFIPSVLRNGLIVSGVQPFWQEIVVGIALALAVGADQLRRRRRQGS